MSAMPASARRHVRVMELASPYEVARRKQVGAGILLLPLVNDMRVNLDCPGPRPCVWRTAVVFLLSLFVAVGGGAAAAGPLAGNSLCVAAGSIWPDGLPDERAFETAGLPQTPGRVVHEERRGSSGEGGRGRGHGPVAGSISDGCARSRLTVLLGEIEEGVLPDRGVRHSQQLGARGPPAEARS